MTLLATKSTRCSTLETVNLLEEEEIVFQRSLNVDGEPRDWDSNVDRSMDLLKHQFLPLIGNTNNLALMID